jgi:hypothetical protein
VTFQSNLLPLLSEQTKADKCWYCTFSVQFIHINNFSAKNCTKSWIQKHCPQPSSGISILKDVYSITYTALLRFKYWYSLKMASGSGRNMCKGIYFQALVQFVGDEHISVHQFSTSKLIMEAADSSENLVRTYQTKRRHFVSTVTNVRKCRVIVLFIYVTKYMVLQDSRFPLLLFFYTPIVRIQMVS